MSISRIPKRCGDMLLLLSKKKPCFGRCMSVSSPSCQSLRSESKLYHRHNKQNQYLIQRRQASRGQPGQGNMPWVVLGGLAVVGVGVTMVFRNQKKKELLEAAKSKAMSAGEIKIGGPFTLVDHNGKTVTDKDFLGQWVLLYFGFTHCPDICPDELEKIAEVIKILGDKGKKVASLFVTLDAVRDTPHVMKEYVTEMSPDMMGLTGTQEQVEDAAKAFRIYHIKGPVDEDGDYVIDHSIVTYLLNPEGKVVEYYFKSRNAQQIANAVSVLIAKYNR